MVKSTEELLNNEDLKHQIMEWRDAQPQDTSENYEDFEPPAKHA